MEQITINVPASQLEFVTQLLHKLSLEIVPQKKQDGLTDEQYQSLLKAQQQIRQGKSLTTEELRQKVESWLTE